MSKPDKRKNNPGRPRLPDQDRKVIPVKSCHTVATIKKLGGVTKARIIAAKAVEDAAKTIQS